MKTKWRGMVCTLILAGLGAAQAAPAAGRRARDLGNVAALRALAASASQRAGGAKSAAAYLAAAQLDAWLCEAALDHGQSGVCANAAAAGAAAAKSAIAMDPHSSDAYRLRGGLLGEVISSGGMLAGMRYGAESTQDLQRAIQLDPKNARAYISRAIGYFYTPVVFGGSKAKAAALLRQAIALDPALDSAHLWLAQVLLATRQPAQAVREAQAALKLDPERMFTRQVLQQARKAGAKAE
jgi:tetratricopeptide (TPR) repeat protein